MNSIMWKYIYESSAVLTSILESNQISYILSDLEIEQLEQILIIGSGSSNNAGLVVKSTFEAQANLAVSNWTPSEFLEEGRNFSPEKSLALVVSQTGTSSTTIRCIQKLHNSQVRVIGITSDKESPVALDSDVFIDLLCGEENSNAKTKGYSATLLTLEKIAIELGIKRKVISTEQVKLTYIEIKNEISKINEVINITKQFVSDNKDWATVKHIMVIGSGVNIGSISEMSLKLSETMCIPTNYSDSKEFSHGMHRTINEESNVIIIVDEDNEKELSAIINYLKKRVRRIACVNTTSTRELTNPEIKLPYKPGINPIYLISIVIQVLSVMLPEVIGYDPNRNCNDHLTKIVSTRI